MGREGSKANTTPCLEPSNQRLARITAALNWERDASRDSELVISVPDRSEQETHVEQNHFSESLVEHDQPRNAERFSFKVPYEEEKETGLIETENIDEIDLLCDEEAEMRRTVEVLFELEESLLDQHISNIKVSCVFISDLCFIFIPSHHLLV